MDSPSGAQLLCKPPTGLIWDQSSAGLSQREHSPGRNMPAIAGSLTSFFQSFGLSITQLIEKGDNATTCGSHEDAIRYYNNALAKERNLSTGPSSIQAALILHKIGMAYTRCDDSFAAMTAFQEALQIWQEKLGPGSEDAAATTAQILNILDSIRTQSGIGERKLVRGLDDSDSSVNVGLNLLEWGEYKEAEAVLKKCLESMNCDDSSQSSERLKALGAMAEINRAQGKYDEAKEHYLKVLKIAKNTNPYQEHQEGDMSIINSISGYAEILRKAGDLLQAEALHMKVRDLLVQSKSETGLHLATSHTQLGCTLYALKKYKDALREHHSALNIRLRDLEISDALVSESFNYCAETLCGMGRQADALPLSLQAVEIRAREFGTSHPAYAHALCVLAKCYHGLDRSRDAMPLIEKCLGICEAVFSVNHSNIIPNLIVYGDILQAVGEREKALMVYERAESIHKGNCKPGQKEFELDECREKILSLTTLLRNEMTFITDDMDAVTSRTRQDGEERINWAGTPAIVITDIGRDIDDALALVILSSLRKMCVINPLAVIITLEPTEDRACLARTILDSLSMHDVPVGIGTDVDFPGEITLHCFDNVVRQTSFQFESNLMSRVLKDAEPKSVKLVCLANLKDTSELIMKHETLFRTKVKEVVVMGGAVFSESQNQLIPDDTAFNNSCDLEAARLVYAECQQNHIPTTTISRYAAYGCPLRISFLDGLQATNHLLAGEIRSANLKALQELWKKVNMPSWMPGRGKLPSRCNREWFLNFFDVNIDDAKSYTSSETWKNSALYIYDSLAMLSCVEAYIELHFTPKQYVIDGTTHRMIGLVDNGVQFHSVVNADKLVNEVDGLLRQALSVSKIINLADEGNEDGFKAEEIIDDIGSDSEQDEKEDSGFWPSEKL